MNKKWSDLSRAEKKTHIIRLLDETDVNSKQNRDNICRSILYLAQGNKFSYFTYQKLKRI